MIAFTWHSGKGETICTANRPGVTRERLTARGSRKKSFWATELSPIFTAVVVTHPYAPVKPTEL